MGRGAVVARGRQSAGGGVARPQPAPSRTIEISSSDDSDEEDSDLSDPPSSSSTSHSEPETSQTDGDSQINYDALLSRSHVPGTPGSIYGGSGLCFNCNRSGHWANGCPF